MISPVVGASTLLLVYEDEAVRHVLHQRLTREAFQVIEAAELPGFRPPGGIDLLLLQLGSKTGLAPVDLVREASDVALIGLLDDEDTNDLVAVLEAGADDCVLRPFS